MTQYNPSQKKNDNCIKAGSPATYVGDFEGI